MKKILVIAIVALSIFALCACNKTKSDMIPDNVKSITISTVDGKTMNFLGDRHNIYENDEYIIIETKDSIYLIDKDNICTVNYS